MSKTVPPRKGTKRRVYKLMDYNDETFQRQLVPKGDSGNFRQPVLHREILAEAYST